MKSEEVSYEITLGGHFRDSVNLKKKWLIMHVFIIYYMFLNFMHMPELYDQLRELVKENKDQC